MRNKTELIILLSKTKNMNFTEKCGYINQLHLTIKEVRILSRNIIRKYFPIPYRDIVEVLMTSPKGEVGLLEISSITHKEVIDWGFMVLPDGNIYDEIKAECSKPPSIFDPRTYRMGVRS